MLTDPDSIFCFETLVARSENSRFQFTTGYILNFILGEVYYMLSSIDRTVYFACVKGVYD